MTEAFDKERTPGVRGSRRDSGLNCSIVLSDAMWSVEVEEMEEMEELEEMEEE